jgi:(p)ppGpp synthase/HD superfamily hydrolase
MELALEFVPVAKAVADDEELDPAEASEMSLDQAVALATELHADTTDKAGRPYIEHPLRVMGMMGTDVERMIAVLHDVLEDTPVTADELLGRGCPHEVVDAVEILTKPKKEGLSGLHHSDPGQWERAGYPRQGS